MPGSATTPDRPGTRAHAPVRIALHLRNSVGTRDMNFCEAQWLAYVLPCRRFAVALTDDRARLGADAVRYSSSYRTCTDYSLPVSRRTAKKSGHYLRRLDVHRQSNLSAWPTSPNVLDLARVRRKRHRDAEDL